MQGERTLDTGSSVAASEGAGVLVAEEELPESSPRLAGRTDRAEPQAGPGRLERRAGCVCKNLLPFPWLQAFKEPGQRAQSREMDGL